MKFKFKAITISGNEQEGKIEAGSREKAIELLQKHKLIIVYIKPVQELFSFSNILSSFFHRVSVKKIVMFSKEIAVMLNSGVPLVEALRIQYEQEESPYFKDQIFAIANKVDDGVPFSSALSNHPETFSDFFINVIKAGEVSGKLQESFLHLSGYLEKQYYLTEKVKNSLMYPAVVIGGFSLVGAGVMLFVLPQLISILKESGQELPITTQLLIMVSDFLQNYFIVIIVVSVVGFFAFKNYIKTPEGKKKWDSFILKIPAVKTLMTKVYIARFAGNLSMLINSGIPIMDALRISGDIVGNDVFRKIIYSSIDEVKIGGSVAYVFERSERIPISVSRMMRIGEKTGKLELVLKDVSEFYTKEIDLALEGVLSLIEPILIFVLGIAVAVLMSAVLLPIYQMTNAM